MQTDKVPEVTVPSAETQCLRATTSSDAVDIPPTLTRTTTESTPIAESSLTTLEGSTSNLSVPSSSSLSQFPTESQNLAPPIEDLDKRFISTFRGRTIHGLTIDLPYGYAGLVLKATNDQPDRFDEKEKIVSGRRGLQGAEDVDVDVEMDSLGRRRRGRLRSSAVPRKGTIITISDDDDNDPQSSNSKLPDGTDGDDIEMAEPLSTPNGLDDPLRILVPTARFDSFTLWQADRTVNKSNDEYWRTLTEWIGLAHEVSGFECSPTRILKSGMTDSQY